ncbi:hypothetical protein HS088_TW18G00687 [Tripterygium wilfordii]|uniref:Uncharacterized protein n=1 Tax=Tripterygium wilfordii TaxID=458696 RepID=A0A7J7CCY5_TRIWF|nr:hypothetical protein HS088_TW18G00687 [Tripterygium wilfordii]
MGNWFAKNKMVHSLPLDEKEGGVEDDIGRSFGQLPGAGASGGSIRMKVRLTKTQFKELMTQTDLSKGTSEFAQLVLRDCSEGKLHGRVVPNHGQEVLVQANKWSLYTINE